MGLKEMTKTVEKFTLREPISIEELNDLMVQNATGFPGNFKLKKGLGKSIVFDVLMTIQPIVTVKGNVVVVKRIQNSTKISIGGGPSVDRKAVQQRVQAAKEGGLGKAITGGVDYYLNIVEVMRGLLQSRM